MVTGRKAQGGGSHRSYDETRPTTDGRERARLRPAQRVFTIAVTSNQDALARAMALVAFALVMSRRLLIARWTATEAPRLVLAAVARPRFVSGLIGAARASAARRIRVTLVVARVEVSRIEIHSRTTLPM